MISVVGNLINSPDNKLGVVLALVDSAYSTLAKPPSFESVTRDVYLGAETFGFKKVIRALLDLASVLNHFFAFFAA